MIVGGGSAILSLLAEAQVELDASGHSINVIELPSADTLFPHLRTDSSVKEYTPASAYPVSAVTDSLDVVRFYIHSSGTTSLPKPIPVDERNLRYLARSPGKCLFFVEPIRRFYWFPACPFASAY